MPTDIIKNIKSIDANDYMMYPKLNNKIYIYKYTFEHDTVLENFYKYYMFNWNAIKSVQTNTDNFLNRSKPVKTINKTINETDTLTHEDINYSDFTDNILIGNSEWITNITKIETVFNNIKTHTYEFKKDTTVYFLGKYDKYRNKIIICRYINYDFIQTVEQLHEIYVKSTKFIIYMVLVVINTVLLSFFTYDIIDYV